METERSKTPPYSRNCAQGHTVLVLSASAAFVFHRVALLIAVRHPFLASGAVAVSSGRGASGSAFVVGVWGGAMVNGSAVGRGAHCRVCASSASCAAVTVCRECIKPWVGDVSRHFCSSCRRVVGDCGSVLSYSLFGERFLFPVGLRTASRTSLMPCCTPYS
jgi:hypothetical protein